MRSRRGVSTLAVAFLSWASMGTGYLSAQPSSDIEWSLAATGDSVITRRISVYDDPPFLNMIAVIRDADVASTNLELSLFRLWEFDGYPQAEHGGNWELGPPEAAEELKWAGFDLLTRANNHTTDYGVEGLVATSRLLDSLGLVHAGAGMNLGEASQAKYLETNKGRFALIGLATTFTPLSRAGEARPDIKGRPGLNALRVEYRQELAPEDMQAWRDIVSKLGIKPRLTVGAAGSRFTITPGEETRLFEQVNTRDEERILRSIRSAARQADFVIVNGHSHDRGRRFVKPSDYIQDFARRCIDAGADTYISHGPHQLRGIEIYRDRPIFYSLGNFLFQAETIEPMPDDMYERFGLGNDSLAGDLYTVRFKDDTKGSPSYPASWESVVAVPVFRGHDVVEIALHPIELGHGSPRPQRGTPRLATGDLAKKIIDRLAELSEPFGTSLSFEGGIGVWRAMAPGEVTPPSTRPQP